VKQRVPYLLAALVATSFVIRTAMAWLRSVPALFPDEYIYSSIGRSIAESGRPLIRGGSAHFPALLQPIVTAPAWLIGDVDTAFRVVQAIGALAMSLSAVPAYLIARRLGLSPRISLALAAFTLLVPDLLYASFVSAESLAYPHQGVGADHDSVGLFQQRPSQGWGTVAELMDPEHSAGLFLDRLAKVPGWESLSVTAAAQAVQRSAYPGAYQRHQPVAEQLAAALG